VYYEYMTKPVPTWFRARLHAALDAALDACQEGGVRILSASVTLRDGFAGPACRA
jgi:hypothetical protein